MPAPRSPSAASPPLARGARSARASGRAAASGEASAPRRARTDDVPRGIKTPRRCAGEFLAHKLTELDAALGATLPRMREATVDEEAVHDMRVAIRRLRTVLRTARPIYGKFHADAVRRAFTEVQRATGALRDEEVLEQTLAEIGVKDAAFDLFRKRRRMRLRALRRALVAALDDGHIETARKLLQALVALPVKPSCDAVLTKFAARCVDKAEREVARLSTPATDDMVAMHDLRIAYKNLRYAMEIFREALPPIAVDVRVRTAVQLQKRLGEIHDVDVAIETVERARVLPEGTRTRVARALALRRGELVARYVALATPPAASGSGKFRASAGRRPASGDRARPSARG